MSALMWLSIAGAVGSTALKIGSSRKSSELKRTEMENRKLAERNSATEQATMRTHQMAQAASSQAVAAAAYGTYGPNNSVYRNSVQQEFTNAAEDIRNIETNAAVKELGMDSRIANEAGSQQMSEIQDILGLSKNLFDTINFYDFTNPSKAFSTPAGVKLPSPF